MNKTIFAALLIITIIRFPLPVCAEEIGTQVATGEFKTVEVEILEVEEVKEPYGGAIYTTKNLISGETLRFFADPYLSLIQSGTEKINATDVLGGCKATIIYSESSDPELPEIIFAKISNSYY